jgi:hypothetical protein
VASGNGAVSAVKMDPTYGRNVRIEAVSFTQFSEDIESIVGRQPIGYKHAANVKVKRGRNQTDAGVRSQPSL